MDQGPIGRIYFSDRPFLRRKALEKLIASNDATPRTVKAMQSGDWFIARRYKALIGPRSNITNFVLAIDVLDTSVEEAEQLGSIRAAAGDP